MGLTGRFSNIRIRAIASTVPEMVVANEAFRVQLGDEKLVKFEKMTGITERRHAIKLSTRRMAADSACALAEHGDWTPDSVDACLFVSQTPDYRLPATACVLHGELGIKHDCVAMDVGLGCSGFVYGLYTAANFLTSGSCRRVLLLGGDCISQVAKPDDVQNQMLFGDAGFAAVIEKDDSHGQELPFLMGTNGGGCQAIWSSQESGGLMMDGPEVFNFTISSIPPAIKEFCETSNQPLETFSHFAFHQANKFILKQIAMLTGFPNSKHLMSIGRYGYTSSASIPLTLCANAGSLAGPTLAAGFGVGLSWGIMSYDFATTSVLPVRILKESL